MMNSTHTGFLLLMLAAGLAGCDGGSSPSPTAPTSPAPPTASLSGLVFAVTPSGRSPVEGALVRLEMVGARPRDTATDRDGLYAMAGLFEGSGSITTRANGYTTDTRLAAINGNVQLDIGVVPLPSYILSGVVFETTAAGPVPIEGVELYCDSCGSPVGHTFVYTDAKGFYSLAWAANGVHPLFVRRPGYEIFDPTGKLRDQDGRIGATVRGDTRFDIELVRR